VVNGTKQETKGTTIEEVQDRMLQVMDIWEIIEAFDLTAEEIVKAFPNKIVEHWGTLAVELGYEDLEEEDEDDMDFYYSIEEH